MPPLQDDEALNDGTADLFEEPSGFYQPEREPTTAKHQMLSGRELTLQLVGFNPLWGHHLWQAGRVVATHLESHADQLIRNKAVLELGAGAGLPSIVCALLGARLVVGTDYPDAELIENLRRNINACCRSLTSTRHASERSSNIIAQGYLWGADTTCLKSCLVETAGTDPSHHPPSEEEDGRFDLLILADLLFNHSEHAKLVASIQYTLRKNTEARALVFFTPYRPKLYERDMDFFRRAEHAGFDVEKLPYTVMDTVMFEDDPGDETLRRTVFAYSLGWSAAALSQS